MNWKSILPKEISTSKLSLDECRNFKKFYDLMNSIAANAKAPPGHRTIYTFLHYLLFYGLCCIEEKNFPALNKCWNALSPIFLTDEYDCEWLVHCWIFCDFPLESNKQDVLLDHFTNFLLKQGIPGDLEMHLHQFSSIMRSSRLGLYQEILSTSKITKYKELFTNNVISTVRSVPYYENGEIFLTRIISYMGDSFAIHDSKSYPAEVKRTLENMVRDKMHFISSEKNEIDNYEKFMKLAGPYWMSCTHADQSTAILSPDEYKYYHC
jgi:hypothetical protein